VSERFFRFWGIDRNHK